MTRNLGPSFRTLPLLIACVLLIALSATIADAQRRGGDDRWELLGEQRVGFRVDTDSIVLRHNEEWYRNKAYRALQFQVEGNEVHLISLRLIYPNGHAEDVRVDRLIPRDNDLVVDLPGERSYLRQIDMRYRSNFGLSLGPGGVRVQQAVVKVYGDRARRRSPSVAETRWDEIDTKRFDRSDEEVVLRPDRDSGRIGSIKLRSLGDTIEIRRITIQFGNGEDQVVRIDRRFEQGEETDAIDLEGRRRKIERVTVALDARRRPGRAGLALLGSRSEGDRDQDDREDPYARRGWSLLGEQSVGFGVDRDVINVNQSEEWYRNRTVPRVAYCCRAQRRPSSRDADRLHERRRRGPPRGSAYTRRRQRRGGPARSAKLYPADRIDVSRPSGIWRARIGQSLW